MDPPASGPERLFDAHRFPSDGFLLLALLLYAPVGLCLLLLRLFIGIHVFLVSCALPDSLLRSSWPFSILDMIQPVALQVQRPLIAVSVADSSWITELFWTFFVPFTVYQVRWMPPVFRQADELNEEFALRVQELLAVELGVISTRLTAADKAEHMKRLRHTPPHHLAPASSQSLVARPRASPSLAGVGPLADEDVRITEMAQRVKEVLPHVSLGTIRRDLAQTNCVDTTIANLLEGRVPLLPEDKEPETGLLAPSTSQTSAASSPQCPAASSSSKPSMKLFAKSPVERHLSLQERKHVLYAYARRARVQCDLG
ncbi:lipid droplet-regulating VLDL assembly factor AUP1 isoform X5 [Lepidochelys kempii]|uniref:lipid droplet-regulating VLDL assembly factor AUP1 isoform X5 n=1 Tax=Lepidochelys kempii TaxID=8472 RepID=UPI003C6EBA9B